MTQDTQPAGCGLGFEYLIEVVRDGQVVDSERVRNLVPLEGLNYVVGILLEGVVPATAWYIGLYSGNYTPVTTDTAATFPGSATEVTAAYNETTRQVFTPGAVSGGAVDNSAAVAQFTANTALTVYGGFMTPVSTKGATSGTLLSAVKFASPKVLNPTDVLRVTAGLTLVSL